MNEGSRHYIDRGKNWVKRRIFHRGIERRVATASLAPEWTPIRGGALRGCSLMLDLRTHSDFTREMEDGSFDAFWYRILDELGSFEGATIWDIGAHIGYHSLGFSGVVGPQGRVIAFEPNAFNAARLRLHLERNAELGNRVTLLDHALSHEDGCATLLVNSNVDSGESSESHLSDANTTRERGAYEAYQEVSVLTSKADTLLSRGIVPPPSVIKIDVEGAESNVILGALELLSSAKPILLLEVHHIVEMFRVQKLLLELGYSLSLVEEEEATPSRCFLLANPAA